MEYHGENYEKDMMKIRKGQLSVEYMKVMGGGHALDENYVNKLSQLNNENDLMKEAMCNNITVNGTVRDHDGPNRGPDRSIFEMKENEVFGDTIQIVNRGSTVRGRDQHLGRVEPLEEAAQWYASEVMKDLQEGA